MYDKEYYQTGCGPVPCVPGQAEWEEHFKGIAHQIAFTIRPLSVIDIGCSFGMLVRHLKHLDIWAVGIDISEYAIENAVDHNCIKYDLLQFTDHWKWDLVTCIEVLEHLPQSKAGKAVGKLCELSDNILFSADISDHETETHMNVQPVGYWKRLFGFHGFIMDRDYDASYITPQARRYHAIPTRK